MGCQPVYDSELDVPAAKTDRPRFTTMVGIAVHKSVGDIGRMKSKYGKSAGTQSVAGRSQAKQFAGKWLLRVLGFGFSAVGLLATWFILVGPVMQIQRAKSWMPVPGTVVASRVVAHRGTDSTTYRVEMRYEYEVDGRTLRGDRYHFMTGSSSGRSGKQAIVDAHPPGKEITVYVNPADPSDAVVERGYPTELWFGLIPLAFCVAGAAMFVASFYRPRRTDGKAWLPDDATAGQPNRSLSGYHPLSTGRVTLRPTSSPLRKFLGISAAALFWNGITGLFVGIAVRSHLAGNPEWFLTIFVIPFLLAGMVLLAAIPYQFLALFNPSPVLEVSTATPALGDTLAIDWRLEGRAERIAALTLSLVGEEHATYRHGKNTSTDKHTFYDVPVLKTSDRAAMRNGGHLEVFIPFDVMHSFDAENNKITWTLKVAGDIKWWPDISDEFRVVIRPMDPRDIARA